MVKNNPYSFMIDEMIWSWSRIETYARCPFAFYLQYILKLKKVDNAFNIYGNIIHDILEEYAKGEHEIFELVGIFKERYDKQMTIDFPPSPRQDINMRELYRNQGIAYFEEFEGFDDFEIIGVEENVLFNIGEHNFTGKIDLVYRNQKGELEIVDHKSSKSIKQPSVRTWKSLKMKRKSKMYHALRQLYLYAIGVKENYGEYPKWLNYNVFRTGEWVRLPFEIDDMHDAEFWVLEQIKKIYADEEMLERYDTEYFCDNICSVKYKCDSSNGFIEEED